MKNKVMIVFGTRPEAIKMLPVVQALRRCPELDPLVVSTGQHREMLDQVFGSFGERPDIDLSIMTAGQTLDALTARALEAVARAITEHRPGMLVVHGDTTTAMAAALAGFYAHVPVAHVEAGLRSHDIRQPWPEEFNRIAIDSVADLLFAPTRESADNLTAESGRSRQIHVTGNTGIDALLYMSAKVGDRIPDVLGLPPLAGRKLVLVTGHRRENFGEGFENICTGIHAIAARPNVEIVYPVHLNPMVRQVVSKRLAGRDNIHLIDPVSYEEMVALMGAAHLVLTDSGGIQEEGPALGKPVVVMREVTERPEGVTAGVVSLVGTDPKRIADEVGALLDDDALYLSRARPIFPYGDGKASARIAEIIVRHFADRRPEAGAPEATE